jgi:CO/xanthine dehydrogenase Mo-binding subunit
MAKTKFNVVGKPVIRQDGYEKVTGQAKFADDFTFPDQLYGVMVRVDAVHARIHSIDFSGIKDNQALTTIVIADDIPGSKNVGPIRKDQPIFASDKVLTSGDVLAMLVGPSEIELRNLVRKIKIKFEALPVLTDPGKAMEKNAPLLHPEYKNNLIVHHPLRKGDVSKGFSESDEILEQTYTTPRIEHAYIEPEVVTAIPLEGRRGIHIIGSVQNPFTARRVVAEVLGWPLTKVRIQQAELGGSFGGKDDTMNILAARAAVAALKTGRPVKIRYTREESVLESYKRHPYIMNYKVGFTREGRIRAIKIDILADGGAYSSMTPFVTWRTVVQATGPYEIEHVQTDVRGVYTNNPYTGAMRGFGSPQPIFAQESLMDEIALRVGKPPDEIRRLNGLREGAQTATGQTLEKHEVNLIKVLDTATRKTGFSQKWKMYQAINKKSSAVLLDGLENVQPQKEYIVSPGNFIEPGQSLRKGIGLALSLRGCSLGAEGIDAAAAYLSLQPDGSCYLLSGLAENGQGLRTTFSIIAAEIFGIKPEEIYYLDMDTSQIADSGPTVASRATLMGGGATREAATIVRKRLEEMLRTEWRLKKTAKINFQNHTVSAQANPGKKIYFRELCSLAYNQGINLSTIGWYSGPKVHWDENVGQGPAYFTYVYGCQVAEISLNIATGEVYVDRVVAVHDPGTVINLLGAQGQVYGGVTQGAGYGLWEEISTHQGNIRELNYDQILIPTSKDIGKIEPVFIEGKESYGPWGAKSLGEPTLELTAAAVNNAIRNALGERYSNLPINLEEILLRKKLRPEDLKRGSA